MLLEASLALLLIMMLTWGAAIWATYDEESKKNEPRGKSKQSSGQSEKSSKKVA